MMDFEMRLPTPEELKISINGEWQRARWWEWRGEAIADKPIVGISLLRCGEGVLWGRSQKGNADRNVELRLSLMPSDSAGRVVQVIAGIGGNISQTTTLLSNPDDCPKMFLENATLGSPFPISAVFGEPKTELWLLLLLKEQVKGARNGLWHIRNEFRSALSPEWLRILTYGRSGVIS